MFSNIHKFTSLALLCAVGLGLAPQVRAVDLYANEAVAYSFADLWSPQNAVGAPDQLYTDFRSANTYVKLDMGEGEEGRDGVTLFFQSLQYGARVVVTFYSVDNVIVGTANTLFTPGQVEWTASYFGEESFRYVKIESPESEQWKLDAIQASAISTPVADEEPVVDEPVVDEEPVAEEESDSNKLIKLASSDAVYVIGDDGKRHPFPNEVTFTSWGYSFADVETVDSTTMASYLIGGSVTVKPGTYLVKIQSVPKVYAVAPNRTLRWIYTEDIAIELFGEQWASEVIDVSDAFWPDYQSGELINSASDLVGWETETQPF
ncbi:MAG: hypothetical protein WAZ14_01615 [Patescibacteria group bacterium]